VLVPFLLGNTLPKTPDPGSSEWVEQCCPCKAVLMHDCMIAMHDRKQTRQYQ
jgi:hypothetical protein